MPFSRFSKQLYFMSRVTKGAFTVTTPYDAAYISQVQLKPNEILILKMDHVLAFSASMFFSRKWNFDFQSILTRQFRYIYLKGPGIVYYFGLGEVRCEELIQDNEERSYDQGAVIGWSNSLKIGISTKSTLLAALLNREDICLDHFVGKGFLITQASTVNKLPHRFRQEEGQNTWLDYVNAFLGLGI